MNGKEVKDCIQQIYEWYGKIRDAKDRVLGDNSERLERRERKRSAFEMMSRIKEELKTRYDIADKLGKEPYGDLIVKTKKAGGNETWEGLKATLKVETPWPSDPYNPCSDFYQATGNSHEPLAELLIRMYQWAHNIALENPLHLVLENFQVVSIEDLDFPSIPNDQFDKREPRFYIPFSLELLQWQGLAATVAEMLANKSQEIQFHEEREYTTVFGHKEVHYKPAEGVEGKPSEERQGFYVIETKFGDTVAMEKLTTHYLKNTLDRRNLDFTTKECAMQLYKTVGKEYPKGGKAYIIRGEPIKNIDGTAEGYRTIYEDPISLTPSDPQKYQIVQDIYIIGDGKRLTLDLKEETDFPLFESDGNLVTAVMPYPKDFDELKSEWRMVKKGEREMEFDTERLGKLKAKFELIKDGETQYPKAEREEKETCPGGSVVILRETRELIQNNSEVKLTVTNESDKMDFKEGSRKPQLVLLIARPVPYLKGNQNERKDK